MVAEGLKAVEEGSDGECGEEDVGCWEGGAEIPERVGCCQGCMNRGVS